MVDRFKEMRIRERHGSIQTWCRMKQLLQGKFLLVIDVHMVTRG